MERLYYSPQASRAAWTAVAQRLRKPAEVLLTSETEALERQRILLLIQRDGRAAAHAWVERTRHLYAEAVASAHSHASQPQYRPEFEASIRVFDAFLEDPAKLETSVE